MRLIQQKNYLTIYSIIKEIIGHLCKTAHHYLQTNNQSKSADVVSLIALFTHISNKL